MIGQTISHYRILEKLGEGGMGVVYKAEDTKLRRTVALKFLPAHALENRERFLREAQAAAALNHPNICTIFEIDEEHGFLAMELIDGMSVKDKIATRPLPLEEALDIAMQACEGLQAAHEKGIIHRDIKPANLICSSNGQLKIADFGLAQTADRSRITKTGSSAGTPAYMSPEQFRGELVDPRTDLWSLGVVLYEMIAGRNPFSGKSDAAVMYAVLQETPEPLTALRSGIPMEMDRVVSKLLAKDTADRYQHASDVFVDIRALNLAGRSAQRIASKPAAIGRKRGRLMAAAAVASLVGVAMAFLVWTRSSEGSWAEAMARAKFTRLTDFPGNELDAAISLDGKLVTFLSDREGLYDAWLGQIGGGQFVNLTKGKFPALVNEGVRSVGFSADATQVWVRKLAGKVGADTWVAPTMGGSFHRVLDNSVSVAWSFDGKRLAFHSPEAGDPLYISELDGSKPVEIYRHPDAGHTHNPTWSPDGNLVYFTTGFPKEYFDVWRMPAKGGKAEQLTHHNSRVEYPALLDDRTLVYVATADNGAGSWLYIMDLDRRVPRRIGSGLEQYTSVSVDGNKQEATRRMVATLVNPTGSIWAAPVSTGVAGEEALHRIELQSSRAMGPRFLGKALLYLSSRGPSDGLWLSTQGGAAELWKVADGGLTAPASPSPDGHLICFSFRRQGQDALYVMNSDGTNAHMLTKGFRARGSVSWSPDGKWIAVSGVDGKGVGRLFKINIEDGAVMPLLKSPSYSPVWSPDGRLIVYSEAVRGSTRAVKAITPDGSAAPFPTLEVLVSTEGYRWLPDSRGMVLLQGYFRNQDFWRLDLATGKLLQITNLRKPGLSIRAFDLSPDGKQIVFDRVQENSDIVLIEVNQP